MPALELLLQPGESVIAESGELSWMTQSITLNTHTQLAGGGGFLGAIRRMAGGGTLFMTEYTAVSYPGEVAFATKVPGHIVPLELHSGYDQYMIHRHGFLCATPGIQLGVGFQQSLGAGIFGGSGFLLQKISGQGTAWLELSGEVVRDLQPGETLRVHPGHVGAFQASVSFQITRVPGIRNLIFGGDGLFLAALTGPGRVWLQTLPISNLAHALQEYLPSGESRREVESGAIGGVVGSILNGMR
ncbi:hypothetical protein GCM10022270_06970 [Terriglobus aquaticus]